MYRVNARKDSWNLAGVEPARFRHFNFSLLPSGVGGVNLGQSGSNWVNLGQSGGEGHSSSGDRGTFYWCKSSFIRFLAPRV